MDPLTCDDSITESGIGRLILGVEWVEAFGEFFGILGQESCFRNPSHFYNSANSRAQVIERKKAYKRRSCKPLIFLCNLVGTVGFEPTTPCTPCKCATRLRYAPKALALCAKGKLLSGSLNNERKDSSINFYPMRGGPVVFPGGTYLNLPDGEFGAGVTHS